MPQQRTPLLQSSWRLIALAFGLSLVMAVELAAGHGFLKALLAGSLPWPSLVLVVLMVAAATGAIMNAFNATLRPSPARIAGTVASVALAMIAGVEASQQVAKLPPLFYFGTSLVGQVLYTYCAAYLVIASLRLAGRWAAQPPLYAAGVVGACGALGFVGQSWMSLETVALKLALVRDLALVLVPAAVLAACAFLRPLRLDQKSALSSLAARLPLGRDEKARLVALALIAGGLAVDVLVASSFEALSVFAFSWLGVLALALSELAAFTGEQRQGQVTAKLAPTSATRFLRRHLTEKQAWAATVGLKTTNFHVDHDPGGWLEANLPASIMQIRAEEIQRCVSEVLGPMYLHNHVVGHRLFGAIDPEASLRPCVDALKMFACLYLDAGPLVERRLKGLASLLPIVDPGLSKVLRSKEVGSLIRRSQWFFHFDFGWIDQAVIHTPRATRYDVRISTVSSRIRDTMLDYLEKTGGVGNFVWLGPEARDRLLQEAPTLRGVIEACPVPDLRSGSGDELLMFIIKFEQLIPRLQRYFDLDTMRKALADFEPSPESARLQGLLGLQLSKAKSEAELVEVLSSITTVPWRGFKEKDAALQLILHAYESLSDKLTPGRPLVESADPRHRALHERLLDAVRTIGYPSQILHNAQVSKIALRDVANLRQVATDPRSPRFHEAWLLLATSDYTKLGKDKRRETLELVATVARTPALTAEPLVQAKAVDALASIARAASEDEAEAVRRTLDQVATWFAKEPVDADVCCLLLDAQAFVASLFAHGVAFSAAASAALDRYVESVRTELGASHPKVVALTSRWQEVRTKAANGAVVDSAA